MTRQSCNCEACSVLALTQAVRLHQSDCDVHNEPAYPNGPCSCHVLGDGRAPSS